MFDISFSELLVVLLVALVVLGPEKMHSVVTSLGRWAGRARVYLRNLTDELERETQAAELKKQFQDAHRIMNEEADALRQSARQLADQADLRKAAEGGGQPESTDKAPEDSTPPAGHDVNRG